MKTIYKHASGLLLTGLLLVMMAVTANAQRGARSGGGGMRVSGGGGFGGAGGGITGGGRIGVAPGGSRMGITPRNSVGYRGAVNSRNTFGYRGAVTYHGGSFYRRGGGYYGYPHLGFYLNTLPYGYYPFYWGSSLYYYYGGVFYRPYDNGGYEVTAPPVGAGIPNLPDGATPIKINGVQYYENDGVYYKETVDDQGKKIYVVAGRDGVLNTDAGVTDPNASSAPQIGDVVNQLPDGCRKVTLNGKKYFVSPNDIYYEQVADANGNVGYRIASIPDDEKSI